MVSQPLLWLTAPDMPQTRDALPWAAPFSVKHTGHVLSATEAQEAFGWAYDPRSVYIVAEGGMPRRVVASETEARANGLSFIFDGMPCCNGHVSPRRLRSNGPPECYVCRSEYRADYRRRKKAGP